MKLFAESTYKINDEVYEVPQLAAWAEASLPISELSLAEIQHRYIWANNLFVEADEEWTDRSMNAQLDFPILMLQYSSREWEIIDGNHRTWKAWKNGLKTINAYVIHSDLIPSPNEIQGVI
jgi:hypothetical protein